MKYRIVEIGGAFYPQERPTFWPRWHGFLSIHDNAEIFYTLDHARSFLEDVVKQRHKKIENSKKKIHPYNDSESVARQ